MPRRWTQPEHIPSDLTPSTGHRPELLIGKHVIDADLSSFHSLTFKVLEHDNRIEIHPCKFDDIEHHIDIEKHLIVQLKKATPEKPKLITHCHYARINRRVRYIVKEWLQGAMRNKTKCENVPTVALGIRFHGMIDMGYIFCQNVEEGRFSDGTLFKDFYCPAAILLARSEREFEVLDEQMELVRKAREEGITKDELLELVRSIGEKYHSFKKPGVLRPEDDDGFVVGDLAEPFEREIDLARLLMPPPPLPAPKQMKRKQDALDHQLESPGPAKQQKTVLYGLGRGQANLL